MIAHDMFKKLTHLLSYSSYYYRPLHFGKTTADLSLKRRLISIKHLPRTITIYSS